MRATAGIGTLIGALWCTMATAQPAKAPTLKRPSCVVEGPTRDEPPFIVFTFTNRCAKPVQVQLCWINANGKNLSGVYLLAGKSDQITVSNVPPLLSASWSGIVSNPCK